VIDLFAEDTDARNINAKKISNSRDIKDLGPNARVVAIPDTDAAQRVMARIGCDPAGIRLMRDKAVFRTIMLENISPKAANLVKQTFLAKGGEAAIARGSADLSISATDVLICATLKQYRLAIAALKLQPWGLPGLAGAIEEALEASFTAMNRERHYVWSDRELKIKPGRTLVMGILNVTPDSFSDGGMFLTPDAALAQAEKMIAEGADIIDIGAESTRPYGAQPISAEVEMERLLPALAKIAANCPVPISVDTYKSKVAEEALKAGAHIINDVWGLQKDPGMADVATRFGVPVVVMHNQCGTNYERDIMSHILEFLRRSLDIGIAAGMDRDRFIIDPGIGFGKTGAQNLKVLSRLEELQSLGLPVLLGTSRKRFIGEILDAAVNDRVEGTAATVALGIVKGANIVRVHDVKAMVRVCRMIDAMLGGDKED